MQDRQVIVLTRNYSTGLSVIRSLGVAGFPVELIASVPKEGACEIAAVSKYVTGFAEVVSRKVKDDADDPELIAAIMQYADRYDEKPILFPTDDYTTAVMDLHRTELTPHFLMPAVRGGTDGTLAGLMDKTVQAEMAKAVGLLVPMAWKVNLREEDIAIPNDMVYPCYCKPIRSIEGYKTEMAVCETEEELRSHLQLMREHFANRDVLVQEYLRIDQEIAIAGACLYDHVIIPAVIRKTRVGKHGRGVTLTGQMARFEELGADIPEKAFALLRSFDYHGTFGMEFNIVGDKVYFNEVNLRSAGENFAYYNCGVNLPLIYVKSLLGEEIDPAEENMTQFGQTLIYDKIAWEDCIYGYISKEELDECLRTADIKILCNDDDPGPGELFVQKNMEELERAEKKRKLQQAREKCIASVMEKTGWEREYALEQINEARERLGISYRDYRRAELCLVPIERQAEAYQKYLKDQELKKLRKECVELAMAANGWDQETAKAQLKDARERLGISYKDYKKYEFYAIPAAQQAEAYQKHLKDQELKKLRKECVELAMTANGWDQETAKAQLKDARERLGISYKDYKKYEFYAIPAAQQAGAYQKIQAKKERLRKQKADCIAAVMEGVHCSAEEALRLINDARERLGISYKDYKKYEFWLVSLEKQQSTYDKIKSIKGEEHGE